MRQFIITFLLFFLSCNINKSPLTPISKNNLDDILKKKIVGTWTDGYNYKITYQLSGAYSDTLYNWPELNQIRRQTIGNYEIYDGILKFTDYDVPIILINQPASKIGVVYDDLKIEIKNDTLFEIPVNIFYSDSNYNTVLWNSWKENKWCVLFDDQGTQLYQDYHINYYIFEKSNSKYIWGLDYNETTNMNDYEEVGTYTYTEPYLFLYSGSNDSILVEFKNEKMYWYFVNRKRTLTRIK